jgi:hypothetical protein
MSLFGRFPDSVVQRILGFLSFNSLFTLSCVNKRGFDLAHKAFLSRGILHWRADDRSGRTWRVLRRGIGCARDGSDFQDGPNSVKIVCVGDPKTGKTCFCRSFAYGEDFHIDFKAVLPVEPPLVIRGCMVTSNAELDLLNVAIWDMPVDETLRREVAFSGMDVAIVFFNDATSFASVEHWLREVRAFVRFGVVLAESKCEGEGVGDELRAAAAKLASSCGGCFVQVCLPKKSNKQDSDHFLSLRLQLSEISTLFIASEWLCSQNLESQK